MSYREALILGALDACYEMAMRITAERDAARAENAALTATGERLCRELEYVWEAESHAARFRDAIDAWRALVPAPGEASG
jgi:organic hydroperoxide reductase OsmC/OhrA